MSELDQAQAHVSPASVLMELAAKMRDNRLHELPVTEAEAGFIKERCQEFPGVVRALWNPPPVRGKKPGAEPPTAVRLVADDPSYVAFILYELMKFRAHLQATQDAALKA